MADTLWLIGGGTREREISDADQTLRAETVQRIAVSSLEADKAEDITVIDLAGKTSISDYMIIASGRSNRHVAALA